MRDLIDLNFDVVGQLYTLVLCGFYLWFMLRIRYTCYAYRTSTEHTKTHLALALLFLGHLKNLEFITALCFQNLCLNSVNHLTCIVNVCLPTVVQHKKVRTNLHMNDTHTQMYRTGGEMTVSNEKWYRFQVCVCLHCCCCAFYRIPLFPVHIKEFNLLFIKKFCVTNHNFVFYYNEMSVINVWELVTIQLYDHVVL